MARKSTILTDEQKEAKRLRGLESARKYRLKQKELPPNPEKIAAKKLYMHNYSISHRGMRDRSNRKPLTEEQKKHQAEYDYEYRRRPGSKLASIKVSKRYMENHPERVKKNRKKYHAAIKNDPEYQEYRRIAARNRRAKIAGCPGSGWTAREERQLIKDYDGRCAYCNKKTDRLTMDHVIPVSRDGAHSIENIVPACGFCNCSKGNKPLLIWMYEQKKKSQRIELLNAQ